MSLCRRPWHVLKAKSAGKGSPVAAPGKCLPAALRKVVKPPRPKIVFPRPLSPFSLVSYLCSFISPSLPINSAKWLHWSYMQPTCQLALETQQTRHVRENPALANNSLPTWNSPFVRRPKLLVLPPVGPNLQPSSDFYTPQGYIFYTNSFVINKSTSKPSTYFVDFCRFSVP